MCFFGVRAQAAAPGKVTGVKQVYVSDMDEKTEVALTWNEASGSVNHYNVYLYTDKNLVSCKTYQAKTNVGIISALNTGASYWVKVSAVDGANSEGDLSDAIEVVTAPSGRITTLKQTKAEKKAISFSWNKVNGANIYDIAYKNAYSTSNKYQTKTAKNTTYRLPVTKTDVKYTIDIAPARRSSTGYTAYGSGTAKNMSTLPTKKVTKVKMITSGSGNNSDAGIVDFSWGRNNAADGYEYQICGNNGKQILKKTTKNYSNVRVQSSKLKNTQFMKIRVRAYINVGKTKKYGPWSDYCWFAKYPAKVKKAMAGTYAADGVKVSWNKTKGATSYTVYVSTTPGSNWKKAGTVKTNSFVIKTCGNSPLTTYVNYYYKVVANKKVGKKTYKSDSTWYDSFRITTSYYYY